MKTIFQTPLNKKLIKQSKRNKTSDEGSPDLSGKPSPHGQR